jgi:hypothetical protein
VCELEVSEAWLHYRMADRQVPRRGCSHGGLTPQCKWRDRGPGQPGCGRGVAWRWWSRRHACAPKKPPRRRRAERAVALRARSHLLHTRGDKRPRGARCCPTTCSAPHPAEDGVLRRRRRKALLERLRSSARSRAGVRSPRATARAPGPHARRTLPPPPPPHDLRSIKANGPKRHVQRAGAR